ncbi:acyl-CoA-binding domain-containing protein 1-like [Tasmannia lanceolata]|uniref:acyl-CoA-binding domain-containing protein 1-like n=1 Tax=Tasmannia lanceolata TaxID=3420 RepID=UPI004063A2DF
MNPIAMGDWQEHAQSIFIGLIFSFLVAKLISMVITFRDENLRIVHSDDLSMDPVETSPEELSNIEEIIEPNPIVSEFGEIRASEESQGVSNNSMNESLLGEDEDDWEGVESTELDEEFSAATAFVAASAADRLSQKVSNDLQLQLYGLYKIVTEGPCSIPQPSALKISARAKWNAWQRLGAMPPEEAMQNYIMIVSDLYPSWAAGSSTKKDRNSDEPSSAAKGGPMGPVFSTFVYEEESDNELKLDAIHASAREGEINELLRCIESSVPVNLRDSEGRTPLHWAVDRGHLNMVELLISKNADVNAQDNEGQTPLHYAVVCEREEIAELLVKRKADRGIKDNDGKSPCDLCELAWGWMLSGN